MARSSIVIDLDDPRSERIAEVMSNKSAKKILALLADGEMSASEIAEKLGVPLNTVTYNISKLVEAGLVEKVNKVFWSSRGKKMEIYKVSNRRIVISPKKIVRGVLPALFVTLLIAAMIGFYEVQSFDRTEIGNYAASESMRIAAPEADDSAAGTSLMQEDFNAGSSAGASMKTGANSEETIFTQENSDVESNQDFYERLEEAPRIWAWYLIGALSALVVLLVWRMFRNE